ncbi:MAG: phage baseplate assembly protein [Aliivibrio sp.]|uniref:phage baseplate assembly protein domain-containing protein n=1 Tax=Aliivibrio sp. TaxID=1872443 RepID=UPI001A615721|nr:phage baseplate assembly protein [Aliivibrio sp.]
MFNRLMSRIKNMMVIGEVTGAKTNIIQIKTSTGRTNDRIKRTHNYGFMSRPKVGAKAYVSFLGGVLSRGFASCVEDERYQMELDEGDVAILDDKGNLAHFTKDGIIVKSVGKVDVTAVKDVTVNTPADIIANGKNIKLNGGTGAITCESICPFMGKPHVDGSKTVTIGKE